MGYHTYFTIDWDGFEEDMDKEIHKILDSQDEFKYNLENNDATWYDHEKDMKELSIKFPLIVFELHGEGDESEDLWYKYFKNGKMQFAPVRLEYDEYDEYKLEEIR